MDDITYYTTIVTVMEFDNDEPIALKEPLIFDNSEKAMNFLLDVYYDGDWGCQKQRKNKDGLKHVFVFRNIKDANIIHKIFVQIMKYDNHELINMQEFVNDK